MRGIGEEIRGYKGEHARSDVVIVAHTAFVGVGGDASGGRRETVVGICRSGVKTQLVMQAGSNAGKGQCQVLGFTVACGQAESNVYASIPALQQSRMLQLLPRGLLATAAYQND